MPIGKLRVATIALLLVGCAAQNKDAEDEPAPDPPKEDPQAALGVGSKAKPLFVDEQRCNSRGQRLEQVDVNRDGRSDLVAFFDRTSGKLSCRQADLNFDGRIDAYFHYDDRGELEREQFDLDFDGRLDIGRVYERGELVLDEQDLDRDGYVDAWRRYQKGRLLRLETDRDRDGEADMFTYYVAGRIDRVGYDVNGDGRPDKWDHDTARRARMAEQERRAKANEGNPKPASSEGEFVDEKGSDDENEGAKDKNKKGDAVKPGSQAAGSKDKTDGASKPSTGDGAKPGNDASGKDKDKDKTDGANKPSAGGEATNKPATDGGAAPLRPKAQTSRGPQTP